jgi:hypothetical protein
MSIYVSRTVKGAVREVEGYLEGYLAADRRRGFLNHPYDS